MILENCLKNVDYKTIFFMRENLGVLDYRDSNLKAKLTLIIYLQITC